MTVLEYPPLTDERCRELKFYAALMSPEERRDRYLLLKLSGATPGQARGWRDYSQYHYDLMLAHLEKQSLINLAAGLPNAPT